MSKRKKRKLKKKRILLLLSIILFLSIGIYLIVPKNYGYKKDVVKVFKEENIIDIIRENKKYSKVLEEVILNNSFDKEYLLDYLNINYIENNDSFINDVNKLLKLGYSSNDINTFYEKLPNSINIIIDNFYDKDITNYLKLSYFKEEYLDRYIKYGSAIKDLKSPYDVTNIINNFNYEDNVTYVNANLDKDYYTSDIDVSDEEAMKLDVIVNKYYKLDSKFEPDDLEVITSKYASGTQKLRKEAKEAFEKMCSDALKDGYKIYAGSTYRSYSYQLGLYNRYVAKDGFNAAETYSARAGYSEHQLGLAVDILNHSWDYIDENDPEYTWLIDNSYKYGFILRYPRGKEYITGYIFEDWHFRYLGTSLAEKVKSSNLTYDEYVAREL